MLLVIEPVPSFERELMDYCERQHMLPYEAALHVRNLIEQNKKLMVLDKEIHGLRAVALNAPNGGSETLLLIDHKNGHQRYVVCVSILNRPIENFQWPCRESICRRKINIAVARLIMMSKSCGLGLGLREVAS